ncbi:MAG: Ig-like domain-containing protein [Gemmatimonadaceae bacterium]|nr:Ig-like domain-containing protein [Gemmatimonadaceae bacterium]
MPITVKVTDRYGNPVPGAAVSWTIAPGAGSVSGTTSNTDASGVATVAWTLGTTAGAKSLTATVAALPPVTFTATANAAGAASLQILSGSGQTFPVGNTLPNPVVIRLLSRSPISMAIRSPVCRCQ